MAPELWNDNYQGQTVDVFALGVTLWIMLVGQFPFEHSKDDFYKALVNQPEFYMQEVGKEIKLTHDALSLILGMLDPDPTSRFTIN